MHYAPMYRQPRTVFRIAMCIAQFTGTAREARLQIRRTRENLRFGPSKL